MKLLRLLGLLSLVAVVNAWADPRDTVGAGVWIDLYVDNGDAVVAGQKLAVQRNARGRIVQEYTAGADGRVKVTVRGEPGETVLEIHTLPDTSQISRGHGLAARERLE